MWWEYRIAYVTGFDRKADLNNLGLHRWELISLSPNGAAVFKRRVWFKLPRWARS